MNYRLLQLLAVRPARNPSKRVALVIDGGDPLLFDPVAGE